MVEPRQATVLDATQRTVLDAPDGASFAVIGAPGTGKTTTLVELVADRVDNRGYSPDEILVLTPTRTSASALRSRLALRLGRPSNGPLARTANSVAFQIVRGVAAIAATEPPVLLTGAEQDQIIAELLAGEEDSVYDSGWPEHLDASVRSLRGFRTELRDLMMRAVENGIGPDELERLASETDRPEWAAGAAFIRGYDAVKASFRGHSFDSAELLREAAASLRELGGAPAEARAAIGSLASLRLIILDDAQESANATMHLIRQFSARGVDVIAFGDPDLTTGSYRGAHPDVLGRLGGYLRSDTAAPIVLDTVHRHGEAIRSAVSAITSRIGSAGAGSQRRATGSGSRSTLSTALASSPSDEIAMIARRLREAHVFEGIGWNDMAVLVRSGSQIGPLERGLAALDVPTRVSSARIALRDEPVVRAFTGVLEVALGRRKLTPELADALLLAPLAGADSVLLRRLKRALRQREFELGGHRSGGELLVEAITDPAELAHVEPRLARKATMISDMIVATETARVAGDTIEMMLWKIWERSGVAEQWYQQSLGTGVVADELTRTLDAVVALFSSAKRFVERTPDDPALNFLEQLLDTDVPEDSLARAGATAAVTVTTPNGAVGTEFSVVVVAGVQENVWPNLRIRGSLLGANLLESVAQGTASPTADERTAVLHDELRMLAQAISRARHDVLITAVSDENSVASPVFRLLPDPLAVAPQRTPLSLRGLVGVLRREVTARADRAAAAALGILAGEHVPGADPSQWYGLALPSSTDPLTSVVDEENNPLEGVVAVSPSRMESFETCPLDWFVNTVGGGSGNTASQLGTIIHKAMETVSEPSADALLRVVEDHWGELTFDADWLSAISKTDATELVKRLAAYLRDFESQRGVLLSAESNFELPVGPAKLRGSIDRVEKYADGSVVIVDLKTGKKVYTADEIAENAQLGAYQLAFAENAIVADDAAVAIPAEATSGGARLVIVSKSSRNKDYVEHTQQPLTESELKAFRQRVIDDALGMAAASFTARVGSHCLDPWSHGACRIHITKAVSA